MPSHLMKMKMKGMRSDEESNDGNVREEEVGGEEMRRRRGRLWWI